MTPNAKIKDFRALKMVDFEIHFSLKDTIQYCNPQMASFQDLLKTYNNSYK